MKISFDFDGCLSDSKFVQLIAKLFRDAGHEIWIITSRDPQMINSDVWDLSKDFDIPNERVIMTNGTLKVHKFKELKIDIHFDNSFDEIQAINDDSDINPNSKNQSMPGILVNFDSEEISCILNIIN
jgi:hypothetical protein